MSEAPRSGRIYWHDLTVADAPGIRDFYGAVAGWTPQGVNMGDYEDFNMTDADGDPVAGICHALSDNAAIPPQWIVYIQVDDVKAAVAAAVERGGALVGELRSFDQGHFCILRDPAGAHFALTGS